MLEILRSAAKANPSLHANASTLDGSEILATTIAEAPIYCPFSSLQKAAAAAVAPSHEKALSTLIFEKPCWGGSHLLDLLVTELGAGARREIACEVFRSAK